VIGQAVLYLSCAWVGASGAWAVGTLLEHDRQLAALPAIVARLEATVARLAERLDRGGG
jgi:hypothetical protein